MIGKIICLVGFLLVAAGAGYKKINGDLEGVVVWFLIIGFILIIVGGGLAFYGI